MNADWNATSGVAQILHKPNLASVATSGSYNDLTNKPTIPAAQVNADWNATSGVAQILHKPNLASVATSGNYNDLSNKPTIPAAQVQSNWNETNTSSKAYIQNKPNLATVATSGNYNDLTNKPTIPTQVKSDWTEFDTSSVAYIKNKPTVYSYNDIQNMINNSLGSLNNRIDSLQNALNAAQQAQHQNNDLSFKCGTSQMYDFEGNAYSTVKIGTQCWMKENLRTLHFADGTAIDPVYAIGDNSYDHRDGNAPAYKKQTMNGQSFYSYNMAAVFRGLPSAVLNMEHYYDQEEEGDTTIQGICPDGWHVPSEYEWDNLNYTLVNNEMYCESSTSTTYTYNVAKALADNNTSNWKVSTNSCAIGNDIAANNASGFSAIGYPYSYYTADYLSGGSMQKETATFWSSSPYVEWGTQVPYAIDSVMLVYLSFQRADVQNVYYNKRYLASVRCIRDVAEGTVQQMQEQINNLQQQLDEQGSKPYVYINDCSLSSNSLNVTATASGGGEILLAKGICWGTTENPTVSSNNYALSNSTSDTYSCTTNLYYGSQYYIRAFATNSNGTSYSTQRNITTGINISGNEYAVPANSSSVITISETTDSGFVWVYDVGGPSNNYNDNCDGYLVIKPGNSAKKVRLVSGTYYTESCCDYIEIYDGTNTTATSGYVNQYKGSGSVTAYTSTAADGSLTIRFRSDYSVTKTGFAFKFQMVGACEGNTSITYSSVTYPIVEIGDQCWMKENLRYGAGTLSSSASSPSVSTTTAYRYYPNGAYSSLTTYGYLYNWKAITNGASSYTAGMQGICPTGWHIPTYAELNTLKNNESNLADASRFNLKYAGRVYASATSSTTGSYNDFGSYADLWGITADGRPAVYGIAANGSQNMITTGAAQNHGNSLRCIKD